MNEHPNSEHTGEDRSDLKKRYATAKKIAITLFAFCFLFISVSIGAILTGLLGGIFGDLSKSGFEHAIFIALGSTFPGVLFGWAGVFFGARALIFRGKLHFEATDNLADAILLAVVKRIGKDLPARVIGQVASQELQRVERADELSKLRRELADLRREREESGVSFPGY